MIVLAPFSSTVTKKANQDASVKCKFLPLKLAMAGAAHQNATQAGSLKNKRPRKIRGEALPSVRKAKGISSTAHNKAADLEDDRLRLRKKKTPTEKYQAEIGDEKAQKRS